MLMSTQRMVSRYDYGFRPVGGGVCKETDPWCYEGNNPAEQTEPLCPCRTRQSYMFLLRCTDIYHQGLH